MDNKDSDKNKSKKNEGISKIRRVFITYTGTTSEDNILRMLEDAFTPKSEFNNQRSNIKPLGDATKIDCITARSVMKRLLDGEDIFDAQLRGNAIAHTLHCGECRKYM